MVGVGKREAHMNWSMVTCKDSTPSWNYHVDYWLCAGGHSAVDVIVTQLRYPISSGLARWRMAVSINGHRRGNRKESRELVSGSA